jgi:hypothetical protein
MTAVQRSEASKEIKNPPQPSGSFNGHTINPSSKKLVVPDDHGEVEVKRQSPVGKKSKSEESEKSQSSTASKVARVGSSVLSVAAAAAVFVPGAGPLISATLAILAASIEGIGALASR